MNKQLADAMLYVDQHGNKYRARSVRELRSKIANGSSRVSKMFVDRDGGTFHVGYVIGSHWLSAYIPMRKPV